jgi:hypothetical protein
VNDLVLLSPTGEVFRAALLPPDPVSTPSAAALRTRVAYAAAHVVPVAWGDNIPGRPAEVDWDATIAFRRHVWSCGLGVADAMDTAQRNMGLDWSATSELIRRSAAEATAVGGDLVVGINTDHLEDAVVGLEQVIAGYLTQLEVAENAGARVVMMASRHLARAAESPADFERVYRTVLQRAAHPVVLHWLGEAFDAQLAGYFGATFDKGADTVIRIIEENAPSVRGIKMSLLDAEAEIAVRRRLPAGAAMFTGDDFHYVDLIEGDAHGHSDALLGAFAAIAPRAAVALDALSRGDNAEYRRVLGPTEALARHIFAAPTQFYKTGVAFVAWLNGHQPAFQMVGGLHSGRSLVHLSEIVRLANEAHALEHPELAAHRWRSLLQLNGIPA